MKKVRKVVLLTLLVMAGLTAGVYFLLSNQEGGPTGEFQDRMSEDQSDLHTDRAYQYDIGEKAVVLSTSGEEKNVLNFDQTNVYQLSNSNAARERLDRLIKRTDASFESPIIALNPFGTNINSFYFFFETSYRCMVRYTITVEEETISDHVRYVNNGQENNLSKQHEFVVSGLVPGRVNYIVIELLDSTGAMREEKTYQFTAPGVNLPERISMVEGHAKETLCSGMYFTFPSGDNRIAAYDNQGVLRNVTVTESGHGRKILRSADSVLYQVSDTKVAKVSSLGRVTGVVQIKKYGKIRDFSYDGFNEIYSIGHKKKQDYLLATSFETGKTRVVYKFPKGISIDSLGVPQGGNLCITSVGPSGLIMMDAITSAKPKISFVLGKKSAWKKVVSRKKVVEDEEVVTWDTSHSVLIPSEENAGRQSMLVGKKGKMEAVEWDVDFAKKKANVAISGETDAVAGSLMQVKNTHFIVIDPAKGSFSEMSKDDRVIRQFSFGKPLDSVMKLTLGGMCFYGI